jgi:rare lipoprotein A
MNLRAFLALLAGAIIIAFAISWMLPLHALAGENCSQMRASWYGAESGNRTANGEHFDGTSLTAAMPSRKHLGERYRVTYRGRSVIVRINDVGPASWTGRGIDLSRAAAKKIGMIDAGVAKVCVQKIG